MKKKKGQDRLKHWYDKGFWGVYKLNCPVCGSEFYTVNSNQQVCDHEKCKAKWHTMQSDAEQKNGQDKGKKVHI